MNIPNSKSERLSLILNESWNILFHKVISGRLKINLEASLQLQFSRIIVSLGELYCILPGETFNIEMETNYLKNRIDIVCHLDDVSAAIELKCFMKSSNRAKDTDMYDVLKDVARLQNFEHTIKMFYCLTDNEYYGYRVPEGLAKSISIKHENIFRGKIPITPDWVGRWKDTSRDKSIILNNDLICNWVSKNNWHYLQINVS